MNEEKCVHCAWIKQDYSLVDKSSWKAPRQKILYQGDSGNLYRSGVYAYNIYFVSKEHSFDVNEILKVVQIATDYADKIGITSYEILINSGVKEIFRRKEHVHGWLNATGSESMRKYDDYFGTKEGYNVDVKESDKRRIVVSPDPNDILVKIPVNLNYNIFDGIESVLDEIGLNLDKYVDEFYLFFNYNDNILTSIRLSYPPNQKFRKMGKFFKAPHGTSFDISKLDDWSKPRSKREFPEDWSKPRSKREFPEDWSK